MHKSKRRWGDRRDARWVREADPMHTFMPYLMPRRTDCEAFIRETIDLTPINAYLEKKNADSPAFRYTFFHVIACALAKCFFLRPYMNRFIAGRRLYERNDVTMAFVAKKVFSDRGGETLIYLRAREDDTLDTIHGRIWEKVSRVRGENADEGSTMDAMGILARLPRPVLQLVMWTLNALDYFGRVPRALIDGDPNYASIFITNLGSIKLNAGYHHLNNWGTNSFFTVIGEKRMAHVVDREGGDSIREVLEIGLTVDERIADGYYYAKTVKLLKHLLAHPELLERPIEEEVDYE